ncbi:hypothetical protein PoB_003844400 [Plakobranchus ocellatus]|uniref:Uncharacterized protein n=1 Tax=Plakobranchus ocellatus TaxID=259542 RepID=A0AAV4B0Q4_9GAST|nr:hypothetical protein PoB_003844400 [Plakobranchus ocellatus]
MLEDNTIDTMQLELDMLSRCGRSNTASRLLTVKERSENDSKHVAHLPPTSRAVGCGAYLEIKRVASTIPRK